MISFKIYDLILVSQNKTNNYEEIRNYSGSPEKGQNNSIITPIH